MRVGAVVAGLRRGTAALFAAALAGCGGGISFGFGFGSDFDLPPEVSLAAFPEVAYGGELLTLVAAASDDFGIDRVEFYELAADGRAFLVGIDGAAPFRIELVLPAGSGAALRFFARAVDGAGQRRDSVLVSVIVRP